MTGVVKAKVSLDRELESRHNIPLVATDKGDSTQSGTATLIVDVLDDNDEAPVFTLDVYSFRCLRTKIQISRLASFRPSMRTRISSISTRSRPDDVRFSVPDLAQHRPHHHQSGSGPRREGRLFADRRSHGYLRAVLFQLSNGIHIRDG